MLYQIARGLGDLNALMKGKIGSRFFNKLLGRKLISKSWIRGGCLLPVVGITLAITVGCATL